MQSEVVDISSDTDDLPLSTASHGGGAQQVAAPPAEAPKEKRKRIRKRRLGARAPPPLTSNPSMADDEQDEDDDEGVFSEGEDPFSALPLHVEPSKDGFDFSGCVPAGRQLCPLCQLPLEVSWSDARQALVHENAVKLRNVLCHMQCVLVRRGPPEDPFRSRSRQEGRFSPPPTV